MIQIPTYINDVTTIHKLQGMSKDVIVVSSWPAGGLATMFKNWEYVVLSHVRTLSGLPYWSGLKERWGIRITIRKS